MYPTELEIKGITDTVTGRSASHRGLHLDINSGTSVRNELFLQKRLFQFPIVNFPHICSNIPASPRYGAMYDIFQCLWFLLGIRWKTVAANESGVWVPSGSAEVVTSNLLQSTLWLGWLLQNICVSKMTTDIILFVVATIPPYILTCYKPDNLHFRLKVFFHMFKWSIQVTKKIYLNVHSPNYVKYLIREILNLIHSEPNNCIFIDTDIKCTFCKTVRDVLTFLYFL